jgi:hypothetical protein
MVLAVHPAVWAAEQAHRGKDRPGGGHAEVAFRPPAVSQNALPNSDFGIYKVPLWA